MLIAIKPLLLLLSSTTKAIFFFTSTNLMHIHSHVIIIKAYENTYQHHSHLSILFQSAGGEESDSMHEKRKQIC
jgi:hypothetical protein